MSDRAERERYRYLQLKAKAAAAKPVASGSDLDGEALGRGALDGATFGFDDELQGTMGAGLQAIANALPESARRALDVDARDVGDAYRGTRDEGRTQKEAIRERSPGQFIAGQVGGGVATSFLSPLRAATAAKGVGGAAKTGAALGAVGGLGASNADLTQGEFGQAAADAAAGAALGGGAGALGYGVGRGVARVAPHLSRAVGAMLPAKEEVADLLRRFAEGRAFKAAGPMLKDFRQIVGQKGTNRPNEIGRELLDSGAVGAGDDVEAIAEKLAPLRNQAGEQVGMAVEALDNAAVAGAVPTNLLSPAMLAAKAEKELLRPMESFKGPADLPKIRALLRRIDELRKMPTANQPGTFQAIEKLKQQYDDLINYARQTKAPAAEQVSRDLRGVVNAQSERVADAVDPALGALFKGAKRRYELLAPAESMASDRALRDSANRAISPSDYIAGAAEHAKPKGDGLLGQVAGIGTALAHKYIRERGNSALAVAADAIANLIDDPTLRAKAVTAITRAPNLAPALVRAAEQGPGALERALLSLRERPAAR